MDRNIVADFFLMILLAILFFIFFVALPAGKNKIDKIDNKEAQIWEQCIEHADDFTYSHVSRDGYRACFKLFDENGTYLCEAQLELQDGTSKIVRSFDVLASPWGDKKNSKKMFDLLYPRIPQEDLKQFVSSDDLVERIKQLK